MYGYYISTGYKGLVNNRWITFATEEDYKEYINPAQDADEAPAWTADEKVPVTDSNQ